MNIQVTGRHLSLTEAIRDYVNKKIAKTLLSMKDVIDVKICLSVEKFMKKAEALIQVKGRMIVVESKHQDMYAAIDGLVEPLSRKIIAYKERNHARYNRGTRKTPDMPEALDT